jgi:hypothetical protein
MRIWDFGNLRGRDYKYYRGSGKGDILGRKNYTGHLVE